MELLLLENSTGAELLRFLTADAETHEATIVLVIERGGLSDAAGRFVVLTF